MPSHIFVFLLLVSVVADVGPVTDEMIDTIRTESDLTKVIQQVGGLTADEMEELMEIVQAQETGVTTAEALSQPAVKNLLKSASRMFEDNALPFLKSVGLQDEQLELLDGVSKKLSTSDGKNVADLLLPLMELGGVDKQTQNEMKTITNQLLSATTSQASGLAKSALSDFGISEVQANRFLEGLGVLGGVDGLISSRGVGSLARKADSLLSSTVPELLTETFSNLQKNQGEDIKDIFQKAADGTGGIEDVAKVLMDKANPQMLESLVDQVDPKMVAGMFGVTPQMATIMMKQLTQTFSNFKGGDQQQQQSPGGPETPKWMEQFQQPTGSNSGPDSIENLLSVFQQQFQQKQQQQQVPNIPMGTGGAMDPGERLRQVNQMGAGGAGGGSPLGGQPSGAEIFEMIEQLTTEGGMTYRQIYEQLGLGTIDSARNEQEAERFAKKAITQLRSSLQQPNPLTTPKEYIVSIQTLWLVPLALFGVILLFVTKLVSVRRERFEKRPRKTKKGRKTN